MLELLVVVSRLILVGTALVSYRGVLNAWLDAKEHCMLMGSEMKMEIILCIIC